MNFIYVSGTKRTIFLFSNNQMPIVLSKRDLIRNVSLVCLLQCLADAVYYQ